MTKIKVTGPLLSNGHDPSHCDDFVGLSLEADGYQIALIRATHPKIPPASPSIYQVALKDAIAALTKAGKLQDITYWDVVVRDYILYIPHHCASVLNEERGFV